MKLLVLTLLSVSLVAADVSHLLGHEHHHEHPGYHYDPPAIPFDLPAPSPTYLPVKVDTPAPTYLPPTPTYLPPAQIKVEYLPPAQPKVEYLPPVTPTIAYLPPAPKVEEQLSFEIPIPSYAEPLAPQEHSGYHYDPPAKPFFY
ncbi:CG11345 [Drosophila busckii]|uniref:CG11345 n=1 Tax=Drosophila busckii TaxID=30019 RepID=A0A0M3QX18_DROBS|nr:extensin [Drosophila busckii]ALC45089.1 CG11345 [Drosophila busckii]